MAKSKKKKPTKYVSLGSIEREGNKFKVKHKVSKSHKDDIDYVLVEWKLNAAGKEHDIGVLHTKESKKDGYDTVTVTRSKYYPDGKRGTLKKVSARAIGRIYDSKKKVYVNKGAWSDWVTFTLEDPSKPTISTNVDADKGEVSFSIEQSYPKTSKKECHDVRYVIKKSGTGYKSAQTVWDRTSTQDKFTTKVTDVQEYTRLGNGEHIDVSCTAYARGYNGSTSNSANHVFAKPNVPVISSALKSGDNLTGRIVVSFTIDDDKAPVDTVQLYRLQSEVTTKQEAANAQGWEEVPMGLDDAQCKGLQDNVADALPVTPGTHVWYRIAAKRDNLETYSEPYECTALYVSKSTTSAGSVNVTAIDAGDGWVKLAVTDTGLDDDCVRVSWSEYEDAWFSTDQPESFDVDWLTEKTIDGKKKLYAEVYVRELENGKRYWFRGRSVDKDSAGDEVLGKLSASVEAIPSSDFGTVSTSIPGNVGIGKDLDVSWTFSSDMKQKSAEVLVADSVAVTIEGTETQATVPAAIFESRTGAAVDVVVKVYAGGNAFSSDAVPVVVADIPSCVVSTPTLTKQPMKFTIVTDSANSPTVTAYVTSHGFSGTGLDGDNPQYEGDCVWSDELNPVWSAGQDEGAYTTEIELPDRQLFWDSARYTVTAVLHDPTTKLSSNPASAEFLVAWAHQADVPTGTVQVDVEELSATITVHAPAGDDGGDGYVEGDRFDLYRVTVDGERRIASNLAFGTTVIDRYAPYGREADLHYIAVTRTADGDWAESANISYELPCAALRFDWGQNESVELPYNIEDSASYSKGYDDEATLDGETLGWWNGSSRRSASLKTSLIKFQSAEQEEAIAAVAKHAGPVFVRTPAGAAFPANVVPSISRTYTNREVSVSFECAEVALTSEHMPKENDIIAPSWNGGSVYVINGVVYDSQGFPMDDWTFLGYSGQTLYVTDSTPVVRNGSGIEMAGYTWDGSTLLDGNGNEVALTEEAQ